MEAAIAHAARLNSEGVLLMNEGADMESAKALTEALSIMQSQLAQQDSIAAAPQQSPMSPLSSSSKPSIEFSSQGISLKSSSSIFIFNRGIYFRLPCSSPNKLMMNPLVQQQEIKELVHVYCVAIIFNLALLYHKRALTHDNDNCYRKADDLYRKITLILGYPNSLETTGTDCNPMRLSDSASIIMIAAINNMSQIRYERGHYDLAEDGIRALSHILQISSPSIATIPIQGGPSTTNQTATANTTAEFWNQIVLNVLLMKQPSLAAAA